MGMLEEVGKKLADSGIGTLGTDLFLGSLPETPDAAVALIPTGGPAPHRAMGQVVGQPSALRPSFQIVARAADFRAARDKVLAAFGVLDGLGGVTLSGGVGSTFALYLWIVAAQSEPIPIEAPDDAGRWLLGLNFSATKLPSQLV